MFIQPSRKKILINLLFALIAVALIFELIRSGYRDGDFMGYLQAGQNVLAGRHLYDGYYLNTWPPLFSIFCTPLAMGNELSPFGIRILWNLGSLLAMFFSMQLSYRMITGSGISIRSDQANYYQLAVVVFPLLIIFRFILDNLANLQINMYMLLMAMLSIHFFIKKKYAWVGLFLALSISLKIYTIFLLLYFIYKRAFQPVLWTLLFLVLLNGITIIVFGWEHAIELFQYWVNEVAPQSIKVNHKNQSLFGMCLRFFTDQPNKSDVAVNFLALDPKLVTRAVYLIVAIISIYPAYLFRKKIKNGSSISSHLEYAFIFTAIPLLSPLAWKYYFIFLWPAYFLCYYLLYTKPFITSANKVKWLKRLYISSFVLTTFSSELFTGRYFSNVLEVISVVGFGAILLLIVIIQLYKSANKRDLSHQRNC